MRGRGEVREAEGVKEANPNGGILTWKHLHGVLMSVGYATTALMIFMRNGSSETITGEPDTGYGTWYH